MSYTADNVTIRHDTTLGGWYASILIIGIQCDVIEGWGDTRQDAIKDLTKQVLKLEQKHRAANEALVRFLGEDAT